MKRSAESVISNVAKKSAGAGHWANALLSSMEDPQYIVKQDETIVVIKDKFPKAESHYLVLPKENISSLKAVTGKHLDLLKHMHKVGKKLAKKEAGRKFLMGYHSEASMFRLHLHVISDDFNSSCVKSKKHWNSYTTEFFLDSKAVIEELEKDGKVTLLPADKCKELMNTPLKCHKCDFIPRHMPSLKDHILEHIEAPSTEEKD